MKLIKISCLLCATAVLIYLAIANALYGQTVQTRPAQYLSPADVYALMCERADDNKPWAEPTAIPVSKAKVEKPFNVTVK